MEHHHQPRHRPVAATRSLRVFGLALVASAVLLPAPSRADDCPDYGRILEDARQAYMGLADESTVTALLHDADASLQCGPPPSPTELATRYLLEGALHHSARPPRTEAGDTAFRTAAHIDRSTRDPVFAEHQAAFDLATSAPQASGAIEVLWSADTTAWLDGAPLDQRLVVAAVGTHVVQAVGPDGHANRAVILQVAPGEALVVDLRPEPPPPPPTPPPLRRAGAVGSLHGSLTDHSSSVSTRSRGAELRVSGGADWALNAAHSLRFDAYFGNTWAPGAPANQDAQTGTVQAASPGRQRALGVRVGPGFALGSVRTHFGVGYELAQITTFAECGGCRVPSAVVGSVGGPSLGVAVTRPQWGTGTFQLGPSLSAAAAFGESSQRFTVGLGLAVARRTP